MTETLWLLAISVAWVGWVVRFYAYERHVLLQVRDQEYVVGLRRPTDTEATALATLRAKRQAIREAGQVNNRRDKALQKRIERIEGEMETHG
jgi:hypothetical protein